MPDENELTRRERNENFGQAHKTPNVEIPEAGEYLYECYFAISKTVQRVRNGVCVPIPPTEFLAWITLTGNILRGFEYEILCAMDLAFCEETNKEISDYNERTKTK